MIVLCAGSNEYQFHDGQCPHFGRITNSTQKWDKRFLRLAREVSTWSKDPSTQTGAVIVDHNRRIVSVGYNGFARGVKDTPERLNDRDMKYKLVVHCERNAVLFAGRSVEHCTLYTWPFMSCAPCAAMMIQAGIKRCVAPSNDNPRWQADFALAKEQFAEARVPVFLYSPEELWQPEEQQPEMRIQ